MANLHFLLPTVLYRIKETNSRSRKATKAENCSELPHDAGLNYKYHKNAGSKQVVWETFETDSPDVLDK